MMLGLQIATGIVLAMHYAADTNLERTGRKQTVIIEGQRFQTSDHLGMQPVIAVRLISDSEIAVVSQSIGNGKWSCSLQHFGLLDGGRILTDLESMDMRWVTRLSGVNREPSYISAARKVWRPSRTVAPRPAPHRRRTRPKPACRPRYPRLAMRESWKRQNHHLRASPEVPIQPRMMIWLAAIARPRARSSSFQRLERVCTRKCR